MFSGHAFGNSVSYDLGMSLAPVIHPRRASVHTERRMLDFARTSRSVSRGKFLAAGLLYLIP